MNDVAVLLAIVVPALSLVPSGVLLLPTRSRPAGALLLMTSVGVIVAAVALLIGEDDVATVVLLGSLIGTAGWASVPRLRRVSLAIAVISLMILWTTDQHRLQPWAYHFALAAWIFVVLPEVDPENWTRQ